MTSKVSDRIASLNSSLADRSEQGLEGYPTDNVGSAPSQQLDVAPELIELVRSHRKLGEAVIIGVTRLVPWTRESEIAFLNLTQSLISNFDTFNFLSVAPWKHLGQSVAADLVTLDAQESRVDPTLVSRILRELPGWKKQRAFVFLDIGKLNSETAQLLASWCDLTILLTQGSLTKLANDTRDIRKWRTDGYPLNAAVHVA